MAIQACQTFDQFTERVTTKRSSGILTSWKCDTKKATFMVPFTQRVFQMVVLFQRFC